MFVFGGVYINSYKSCMVFFEDSWEIRIRFVEPKEWQLAEKGNKLLGSFRFVTFQ